MSYERVGWALVIAGAIMAASGLGLPLVKQPQEVTLQGPKVEFTPERSYWIDTRIIPPIDEGSPIEVDLSAMKPGRAALFIYPSTQDGDLTGAALLAATLDPKQHSLRASLRSTVTSHYMLVVTVWNNTYVLRVRSIWSPFYGANTIVLYGVVVAMAGVALSYYGRVQEEKLRLYQRTLKAAT